MIAASRIDTPVLGEYWSGSSTLCVSFDGGQNLTIVINVERKGLFNRVSQAAQLRAQRGTRNAKEFTGEDLVAARVAKDGFENDLVGGRTYPTINVGFS